MDFTIVNLLEMSLQDDDVNKFATIFGSIKQSIDEQKQKAGFTQKDTTAKIVLDDELVKFVDDVCIKLNIIQPSDIVKEEDRL